jgi:hypothetical protein
MHTGLISFCDRIAYNVKCSDAKDTILDPLEQKYHIRILQKHWYRLDDVQYKYVTQIPHKVCIRSNGNPYFLYFTRYEDVPQIMYIDKKVQPNYHKPRIILTRGQFAEPIFDNTLIEGEMVKDNKNRWIFLINDVLMYKGTYLKDVSLHDRLKCAVEILENHYTVDDLMDVCTYQIKKYVECTKDDVEELIAFSKTLPYTNRGIYFVPCAMKYKPKLINFNDSLIKSVFRKVKDCPDFIEKGAGAGALARAPAPVPVPLLQKQLNIPSNIQIDDENKLMWLRKTDQPDVYDIYDTENSLQKQGTALVSSLSVSKMLRAIFKNMNVVTSVSFLCKYDPAFQKWIPMKDI